MYKDGWGPRSWDDSVTVASTAVMGIEGPPPRMNPHFRCLSRVNRLAPSPSPADNSNALVVHSSKWAFKRVFTGICINDKYKMIT